MLNFVTTRLHSCVKPFTNYHQISGLIKDRNAKGSPTCEGARMGKGHRQFYSMIQGVVRKSGRGGEKRRFQTETNARGIGGSKSEQK
jgi:hypothetical protein